MAAHSSILAWRIPMDRGAWWATVCGVAQNLTQLKRCMHFSNFHLLIIVRVFMMCHACVYVYMQHIHIYRESHAYCLALKFQSFQEWNSVDILSSFSINQEIPHAQGKRNPSKTVCVARGHQRADTLKLYSQETSQSNHTRTTALSNSMKLSHARGATQDGRVMGERSDRIWSTGEGNGKPLQYSCLENPMNSMKRQKDRILKDELPRSVGAQYATGDQWRNNSRKNEGMEPKQKEYPAVDVTGDRNKV